jgi:hypothetical protein
MPAWIRIRCNQHARRRIDDIPIIFTENRVRNELQIFCNDVICRYEKFARKVALAFPEYQPMNKMKGMLPRMHAKSHHWPCRVQHWNKKIYADYIIKSVFHY